MTQLEAADPTHVLKHNWANEKLLKEDSYGFLSIHRASPKIKGFLLGCDSIESQNESQMSIITKSA